MSFSNSALEFMAAVRVSLSPSDDDAVVQNGGETNDSDSSSSGSSSWSSTSSGSDSDDGDGNENTPRHQGNGMVPSVPVIPTVGKGKGKVTDKVGLRFGKGMLSIAVWSAPDKVMAVPVPFTPQLPASRIGGKGKGYAENQACDKGKGKVEFVEGLAQDPVVSSPCTSKK